MGIVSSTSDFIGPEYTLEVGAGGTRAEALHCATAIYCSLIEKTTSPDPYDAVKTVTRMAESLERWLMRE